MSILVASDEATSGSVIAKAERISPLSSGSSQRSCCSAVPYRTSTSMLPVSGAEQLNTSGAQGERPMISQSGAYSRLVSPAPYSLSGRNRFHSPAARAFAFRLFEERHRLPAVAFADLREHVLLVRIDVLGHEGRDTLLQLPNLVRMLKLHGSSFLEGPTIVSYDLSVALPIGGSPSIVSGWRAGRRTSQTEACRHFKTRLNRVRD